MAKKMNWHDLLEVLPDFGDYFDDAWDTSRRQGKKVAKRIAKEAKNPVVGWVAIGLVAATAAVIAYSLLKPEDKESAEDSEWMPVEPETDSEDAE
jgi:hypothetical protein